VQVKDRSQPLNCITKELIDSGRQLREISDEKVDCLKAFVSHKKFADWLKDSLRGSNCLLLSCCLYCYLPRCIECRHGIAMRILSVHPSVHLSNTWIVMKRKKDLSRFLYNTKDYLA